MSTNASYRGGSTRSSDEVSVMEVERRGRTVQLMYCINRKREEYIAEAKSFEISRHSVMEAWRRIKSNGGSAGVDGQSIKAFEEKLKDNLYKIWNRMSSGSYFPPVKEAVEALSLSEKIRDFVFKKIGISNTDIT